MAVIMAKSSAAGNAIVAKSNIPAGMSMEDAERAVTPTGKAGNTAIVPERLSRAQVKALENDPKILNVKAVKSSSSPAGAKGAMVANVRQMLALASQVRLVPSAPKVSASKSKPEAGPRVLDVQDLARDVVRLADGFQKKMVDGKEILVPKMSEANTAMLKDKYDGLPKDKATLDALADAIVREVNGLKAAGKFGKVVVEVKDGRSEAKDLAPSTNDAAPLEVYGMARRSRNSSGNGNDRDSNERSSALVAGTGTGRPIVPRDPNGGDGNGGDGNQNDPMKEGNDPSTTSVTGAWKKAGLGLVGFTAGLVGAAVIGSGVGIAGFGVLLSIRTIQTILGAKALKYQTGIDSKIKEASQQPQGPEGARQIKALMEAAKEQLLNSPIYDGKNWKNRGVWIKSLDKSFKRDYVQLEGIRKLAETFESSPENTLWKNISDALKSQPPGIGLDIQRRASWWISWLGVRDFLE